MVVYSNLSKIDILIQKQIRQDAILGGLSIGQVCRTICSHINLRYMYFLIEVFLFFMTVIPCIYYNNDMFV